MEHAETFLLIIGAVFILSSVVRTLLKGSPFPSVIGYLLIGFFLNFLNTQIDLFDQGSTQHLHLFSEIGLMLLLFRVGIGSDIHQLLAQIKKAILFATSNFLVSGIIGFLTSLYILQNSLITSLFIATALSATSVGVTTAVWTEAGHMKSPQGSLLVDMAEIDDILGILAMIFLFTLAPKIVSGDSHWYSADILFSAGEILLKTTILIALCYGFSKLIEPKLSQFAAQWDSSNILLISITIGMCAIISFVSLKLGFSVAVGSFFAGLAYSKDPNENKIEQGIEFLYQIFVPFFFVGIAMAVDLIKVGSAIVPGLVLSLAAILGKVIGVVIPAVLTDSRKHSLLLGVSMIPRAEIALVIMISGVSLEGVAIPQAAYISVVIVSICTSIIGPVWSNLLLKKSQFE